jgi:hypothetical protein
VATTPAAAVAVAATPTPIVAAGAAVSAVFAGGGIGSQRLLQETDPDEISRPAALTYDLPPCQPQPAPMPGLQIAPNRPNSFKSVKVCFHTGVAALAHASVLFLFIVLVIIPVIKFRLHFYIYCRYV